MHTCNGTRLRRFVGTLLFAASTTALAGQPLIDRSFYDSGVAEIADCGAFSVVDDYKIWSTVILFLDGNGTLVRFIEQNYGTDTLSNAVSGKTLPTSRFHNTVLVDRVEHTGTTAGIVFRVAVPGAGEVLLDVGRIVTQAGDVVFEAGPHDFFDGDLAGLCAALE